MDKPVAIISKEGHRLIARDEQTGEIVATTDYVGRAFLRQIMDRIYDMGYQTVAPLPNVRG